MNDEALWPVQLLTAADYRSLSEGPPWFELIDGHLVEEPAPEVPHQDISLELSGALWLWNKSMALGRVLCAPCDVYLSDRDVLQPDILYVSRQRGPIVQRDGVHAAPDLVAEILSPANGRITRTKKKAIYARSGVKELWLIDPVTQTLQINRFAANPEGRAVVVGDGDLLTSPLLPGFQMAVSDLFPSL